ncbi:MAG: hypothetical protein GY832_17310 [Chloroflexi bacterium]|nr:hypothetical protein [Chloroflexota bacterium]
MLFLQSLIELITVSSGNMVYHIVTLFAVQSTLAMAFGHWNRNRRDWAGIRLVVIAVGLFFGSILLIFVGGLDFLGLLSSSRILPPLERFLNLATLLLAAWAFLPILARQPRLGIGLLIFSLAIVVFIYAAFAVRWTQIEAPAIFYNDYAQAAVWEYLSIIILLFCIVASMVWRENDWSLVTFLFSLWFIGHILQLVVSLPANGQIAGWVRLSNLAVLPLITSFVHRRTLSVSPGLAPREDSGMEIIGILGAAQRVETARDTEAALKLAAPSIAHALGADMVAIALPDLVQSNSPQSGLAKKIRVVALHPSTGTTMADQEPSLLISRHPLLVTAIKTGSLRGVSTPEKDATIVDLYSRLGFERPGPLLALPLMDNGTWLGIILAGNPVSRQSWTLRNRQIFQAAGAAITRAMLNASRRDDDGDHSAESQKSLDEARRLAQRTAELEAELAQQQQRTEELATKLRLREQENDPESMDATQVAVWQEEIQNLTDARTVIETELAEWREKAEQLALSENDLQDQLVQTHTKLQEARSQAASLNKYGPPVQYSLTPRGFLIGDEEGNIIIANQGAQHLIGQPSSILEGTSLQSLFTEPSWIEAVQKLSYEKAQDNDVSAVVLKLDGQMIRAEITRVPSIAGGMGSLSVMFYPAERVTRQNDIVTSLMHELRTPMTSITGYTELLLGESVGIIGETQRQLLQRVNANVERMGGLLDDLVKVSSIDANQDVLEPEPVDLVNIIENAIMSLAIQFSERDLNVQMDMPSELPSIHADPDSLYQIVLRLLSNACQCSTPGTEVMVRARLEEYDTQMDGLPDYLFMSVTDTGGGIAPKDQQRVFQRLYRADNPLIEGVGDTGVGLSIAKALVEMQGGRIWADSEVGIGSTFSFILPLSPEGSDSVSREYPSLDPFPMIEESEEER